MTIARGAVAVMVLASAANADPDLKLHREPISKKLAMRPKKAEPAAKKDVAASGATPDADQTQVSTSFKRVPTSVRDIQERVNYRFSAGYELAGASTSGQVLPGGAPLPANFAGSREWIVGDVMVGAKDILLPSLGGYFLGAYQFDTSDALASRSDLVVPGDATGQRIAIKAGYAEYGSETKTNTNSPFWIRAGRQFRLDAGNMFAYFDGLTVGYHTKGFQLSLFGGERAVLYVNTPGGLMFGATASIDLKATSDIPAKISADFMGLQPDSVSGASTMAMAPPAPAFRDLVAISATYDPNKKLAIDLRARFVDGGQGSGFGFGRAGARIKYVASNALLVVVDAEQRAGTDLAYDLAAPSAVDIINISRALGMGLAGPTDSTLVGARVDWRRGSSEVLVFGRADVPETTQVDPNTKLAAAQTTQNGWIEAGAALAQYFGPLWATFQYTFRDYLLDATQNVAGTNFNNLAGSGIGTLHELAIDATHRTSRGARKLRWALGGFARIYDYQTPYLSVSTDARFGARGDIQFWFTKTLRVAVLGEVAQPSPTLARELSVISSLRGSVEARW